MPQILVVAGAVLLCLTQGHGSKREADEIRREEEARHDDGPGWLWDLDVGPKAFPREHSLGRSLAHRRPGLYEGINELTGNLTQKFGPLFMNTLGHDNLGMSTADTLPQPDVVARIVQQRDRHLYGSPGIFSLATYDVFLFDHAVLDDTSDTTGLNPYQTSLKLVLEDRTMVEFRPSAPPLTRNTADPAGFVATPYLQARLDYIYNRDTQTIQFEDGRTWIFERISEPGGAGACDWEWNHTFHNAITWAPDQRIRDYMSQVRAGKNRIYVLRRELDRYGNEVVINRAMSAAGVEGLETKLCRITDIVENRRSDGGGTAVENTTLFEYEGIAVDSWVHEVLKRVRLFANTPDEKFYELTYNEYPRSRLARPPHLVSLRFGEKDAPLNTTVVHCFQYHFPYEGTDTGEGILRSIEGPYDPTLRMAASATGYCHPDPPSNVISGHQAAVGPVVSYRLDRLGHLRELTRPDGTGMELFYPPDRSEIVFSHTWPMVKPRHPGSGSYERDEHTDAPSARMSQAAATLIVERNMGDGLAQVSRRYDNYGRFWDYQRNDQGYVTRIESYDGQVTTMHYEDEDPMSPYAGRRRPLVFTVEDTYGSLRTFRYDDWGRVRFEQGPSNMLNAGPSTTREYHASGPLMGTLSRLVTTGIDPFTGNALSEETTYAEGAGVGGAVAITETNTATGPDGSGPESITATLTMDASGRIRSFLNPAGTLEQVDYTGSTEHFTIGTPGDGMNDFGSVTRSATGAPTHVSRMTTGDVDIAYNETGQLLSATDELGAGFGLRYDDRFRVAAMSAFSEDGDTDDQNATVRFDRDNACGRMTGMAAGVGSEWEADLQYMLSTAGTDEPLCGIGEEIPDCPPDAYTPTSCAAISNSRTRRVYCEDDQGCGLCIIAYSDDRYCIDTGFGEVCGGSCTQFPFESFNLCAGAPTIPTCPF